METKSTKQSTKQLYRCEVCDYNTCNKSNFNKHISTRKHQMETGGNPKSTKQKKRVEKSEKNEHFLPFFVNFVIRNIFRNQDFGNTVKGVNIYLIMNLIVLLLLVTLNKKMY